MATIIEGNQPYTPTRLQWLTLELNAIYSMRTLNSPFHLHISCGDIENTLLIHVAYPPNEDIEKIQQYVENIKLDALSKAAQRNFESWFNIDAVLVQEVN